MDVDFSSCGKKEKETIEEVAVARSVLDVFDECLKEVRMIVANQPKEEREKDFERRWREQRFAEFDVLTRRLRMKLCEVQTVVLAYFKNNNINLYLCT